MSNVSFLEAEILKTIICRGPMSIPRLEYALSEAYGGMYRTKGRFKAVFDRAIDQLENGDKVAIENNTVMLASATACGCSEEVAG